MSETAFIALGSNLGDRRHNLAEAARRIGGLRGTRITGVSGVWETAPVGKTDQPAFLNATVRVETERSAAALLEALLEVEGEMGRVRRERWGPRVIDLDLILHGGTVMESERLTLPHPRARERLFVLIPMLEIEPTLVDPLSGEPFAQIAARLDEPGWGERAGQLER